VVDLAHHQIEGLENIHVTFMHPLWAWIKTVGSLAHVCDWLTTPARLRLGFPQANRSEWNDLHFRPRELRDGEGNLLFGGGPEYGTWFADAVRQTPVDGSPAVITLAWDGGLNGQQHSKSSSCPVLLQVGNNKTGSSKNTCMLMYMPKPVLPKSRRAPGKPWRAVQLDVKQQIIAMIRDALAPAAENGYRATVCGRDMKLYPILCTVVLDHPEMQDFIQASNPRFSTARRIRKGRLLPFKYSRDRRTPLPTTPPPNREL
jgi:hypothetical protein